MKKADLDNGYFKIANALAAALASCGAGYLELRICLLVLCLTYGRRAIDGAGKLRAVKFCDLTGYAAARMICADTRACERAINRLILGKVLVREGGGHIGFNTRVSEWSCFRPDFMAIIESLMGYQQSYPQPGKQRLGSRYYSGPGAATIAAGEPLYSGPGAATTRPGSRYFDPTPHSARAFGHVGHEDMRERGAIPPSNPPPPPGPRGQEGEKDTASNNQKDTARNGPETTPKKQAVSGTPEWTAAQDLLPKQQRDPAHRLTRAYQRATIGFPTTPERQAAWEAAHYARIYAGMREILATIDVPTEDAIEYVLEATEEKKHKPGFNLRWLIEDAGPWAAARRNA